MWGLVSFLIIAIVIWRVSILAEIALKRMYLVQDRSFNDQRMNKLEALIESFPAQVSITTASYNDLNERVAKLELKPVDKTLANKIETLEHQVSTINTNMAFRK